MDKKAASVVLFSICTMAVICCGLWGRQFAGKPDALSYGLFFIIYVIPLAAFGWGLLMGCLAVKPLWRWPLLAGLWEVLFTVVLTADAFGFDLLLIFYLVVLAITAVGTVVGYGLYKLVHLKDEAA